MNLAATGTTGWKKIGTYSFNAGQDQWVAVFDNSDGFVGQNQSIVVDSIRLLPIGTSSKIEQEDADIDDDIFEEEVVNVIVDEGNSEEVAPHPKDFDIEIDASQNSDDIAVEGGCSTTRSTDAPLFLFALVGMFFMFRRRR